ncbi:MAG TPA: DUF1285 domain-containing protein [Verrucomicrobiae bacterium]|nr:DUF1285 domain-containing protein [Verrucomicrobiae bacterium]
MKASASNPTGMLARLIRGKSHSYQDPGTASRQRRVLDDGFDMRIAADGTWFYQGTPINRLPLVKLFASVLRREDDGEYWLVTPVERGRVRVEDAPFTAVEVTAEDAGPGQRLIFRTNLDEIVALDEAHPLQSHPLQNLPPQNVPPQNVPPQNVNDSPSAAPRPYILVRDGLEARVLRSVYYHLVELGEQQGEQFGVWSSGRFFPLGSLNPAL